MASNLTNKETSHNKKSSSSIAHSVKTGEAYENRQDEADVLTDQDATHTSTPHEIDENLGAKSSSLGSLEKEPADFMSGEVDVKEQIDKTTEAFEDSILGVQDSPDSDNPQGELESSYQATPGGLEEVIVKSDKYVKKNKSH